MKNQYRKIQKITFITFVFLISLAHMGFANTTATTTEKDTYPRLPGLIVAKKENIFTGKFLLSSNPNFSFYSQCKSLVQLTLDQAEISGKIALLDDSIQPDCTSITPMHQHVYSLEKIVEDCGSKHYYGKRLSENPATVEIIDHRNRFCKDRIPARVVFVEKTNSETTILYSVDLPSLINTVNSEEK